MKNKIIEILHFEYSISCIYYKKKVYKSNLKYAKQFL